MNEEGALSIVCIFYATIATKFDCRADSGIFGKESTKIGDGPLIASWQVWLSLTFNTPTLYMVHT